jgi:hypothetical protein
MGVLESAVTVCKATDAVSTEHVTVKHLPPFQQVSPRLVRSRNFIVLRKLQVNLIFSRETCQKFWELESILGAMKLHLYHETLLAAKRCTCNSDF